MITFMHFLMLSWVLDRAYSAILMQWTFMNCYHVVYVSSMANKENGVTLTPA
jgi:hypothetical protein